MHMEQVKKNISYGIYKAKYHSCSYLLLLEKRKLLSFDIPYE